MKMQKIKIRMKVKKRKKKNVVYMPFENLIHFFPQNNTDKFLGFCQRAKQNGSGITGN